MLKITHEAASPAILAACDNGTLVQGRWHGREDGREIACLLGSIHPKVKTAADCNGDLMPLWLAELTPTLFDSIPADQTHTIARRYGELVSRWHALSLAQWDAILTRVLVRCIDDAVGAARPVSVGKSYWPAVEAACEQVKAALLSGDKEAAADAAYAAYAARAAARATAYAAARAAAYLSLFNFVLDQIEVELATTD